MHVRARTHEVSEEECTSSFRYSLPAPDLLNPHSQSHPPLLLGDHIPNSTQMPPKHLGCIWSRSWQSTADKFASQTETALYLTKPAPPLSFLSLRDQPLPSCQTNSLFQTAPTFPGPRHNWFPGPRISCPKYHINHHALCFPASLGFTPSPALAVCPN